MQRDYHLHLKRELEESAAAAVVDAGVVVVVPADNIAVGADNIAVVAEESSLDVVNRVVVSVAVIGKAVAVVENWESIVVAVIVVVDMGVAVAAAVVVAKMGVVKERNVIWKHRCCCV